MICEPQGAGTSVYYPQHKLVIIDSRVPGTLVQPVVKTKNRGPIMSRGKGKSRRNYE